jgi:hypothetical protein
MRTSLVFLLAACVQAQTVDPDPTLARRLPADTLFAVELRPDRLAAANELTVLRFLRSPALQGFLAPARELLEDGLEALRSRPGLRTMLDPGVRDLLGAGRWVVAGRLRRDGGPGLAFSVVVGAEFPESRSADLRRFVADVAAEAGASATAPGPRLHECPGLPLPWMASSETAVAFASSAQDAEAFVEAPGRADSLAGQAAFRAAVAPVNRPGAFVCAYLSIQDLLVEAFSATDEGFRDAAGFLGWGETLTLGYAAELHEGGILDRTFTFAPHGTPQAFLAREADAGVARGIHLAPATCTVFTSTHVAPERLLDQLRAHAERAPSSAWGVTQDVLAELDARSGLRLRDDVASFLGPEIGAFVVFPERRWVPDLYAFARVRDARRVEVALERLERTLRGSHEVRRWESHGRILRALELPLPGELPPFGLPLVLRPTILLLDDFLVVSLFPQGAETLLEGLAAGTPRLASARDLAGGLERLRALDPAAGRGAITYLDLRGVAGAGWDQVVPLAQMFLPDRSPLPVHWSMAPAPEAVESAIFGATLLSRSTEDGSLLESWSPAGSLITYAMLGTVMALVFVRGDPAGPGGGEWEEELRTRADRAMLEMLVLRSVVEEHCRKEGRFPSGPDWVQALRIVDPDSGLPRHPALDTLADPGGLDPWGNPYVLRVHADGSFEVLSLGADGFPGGEGAAADIVAR